MLLAALTLSSGEKSPPSHTLACTRPWQPQSPGAFSSHHAAVAATLLLHHS